MFVEEVDEALVILGETLAGVSDARTSGALGSGRN